MTMTTSPIMSIFRTAFVFLLFLALHAACPAWQSAASGQEVKDPKQVQLDGILERARNEIKIGAWEQASASAAEALQLDNQCVPARVVLGQVALGKKDWSAAITEFDLALVPTKRDSIAVAFRADAYCGRSKALYEQGKFLEAIDSAYLGTVEKSDHIECHMNRARAYIARNEYDRAINSLNRILQIDPKSADAYSMRGLVYGAKRNFDQAIADENKAIELDGKNAFAFQRRAEAYFGKKDLAATIKDIEQALSIQPGMPEALCDRAILYSMNRNPGKAMEDLNAALASNPRFGKAHLLRGKALQSQGNYDDALKSLDAAVAAGEDPAAYCTRGQFHYERKNYEQSLKDFNRAIEIDPKMALAYQGRSQTHKKLGNEDESKEDQIKAKELTPKPPEKKPEKKSEPPPPPRFVVKSKGVDPLTIELVKRSAAQVDKLVAANYAKTGTKPNPMSTDSQFVRRVYLDIVGTIPSFRQTSRFLNSPDPDKRSKLIDELLSSEGYASHYFNYWADILRYKDQLNGNVRGEPFRQWIKQSLAENKPWNKMVYQMLTAEGLIWQNPATGYLQRDPGMQLDTMNNTTRIFLGTRIGCAQCHNHPFDRWTQKEFYQMAAFMYQTQPNTHGGDKRFWEQNPNDRLRGEYAKIVQEEEDKRVNIFRFDRMINMNMTIVNDVLDRKITLPKDYAYEDAKPGEVVEPKALFGKPAQIKKDEPPRRAFARWLVAKDNPRFSKTIANRLWKQLFGIGQIEPVDDMNDETVAENPELMKFLEEEMVRLNFDMKEYLRVLLHSETYQRQACTEDIPLGEPYHFPGPMLRRMTAEQVWDSFLTLAIDPVEYREPPADLRTKYVQVDLKNAEAMELLQAESKAGKVEGAVGQYQAKYRYKGELLARASELPSPVPANHFLRMFGQSDRELIAGSSKTGSVPQILVMFNGPISHMFLEKNSTIYNNIVRKATLNAGIRSVFLTVLSRDPDDEEVAVAMEEIKQNGAIGYGNVVWSLVNTREFLFIQ
jgi:tetratricopeptide (TPR) repeat protein